MAGRRRRASRLARVIEDRLVRMRRATSDGSEPLLDLIEQPLLRRRACDQQRAITNRAVAADVRLPCQRQERGALLLVDEGWKDEDEWILADLNNVVFVARALRHCQAERAEPAGREKRNLQV